MHLEVTLESDRYVVLENIPLSVRIVNPNDYAVTLRGFDFGYIEPKLEGTLPDGEFVHLFDGAHVSAWRKEPVVIPARASV